MFSLKRVRTLSLPEKELKTTQQQTIPGCKIDANPITKLTMINEEFYKDYSKLSLIHERVDHIPHRLGGIPEYQEHSITGGKELHSVFYSSRRKLAIFKASKQVTNGANRALNKEFPTLFDLFGINVDFGKIIDLAKSNITGSWFTGLKGKVNTVGIFGDRVNLDESFDRNSKLGQISAIYLEMAIVGQEELVSICITRSGGIVLHQDIEGEENQLDFIEELIDRLDLLGQAE